VHTTDVIPRYVWSPRSVLFPPAIVCFTVCLFIIPDSRRAQGTQKWIINPEIVNFFCHACNSSFDRLWAPDRHGFTPFGCIKQNSGWLADTGMMDPEEAARALLMACAEGIHPTDLILQRNR